ncbi:MAG: 3-deoxy-8-phosphooctulonate synthase [Acidobacteriota bacterium]|nr:3-deoxy-8-phosphooctulonate synthase [Acidobacteriota bacterium]MDQ5872614.1 3-deoxy-8-phosphooctulonate synthase [Acidobacteriota bacterium]
MQVDPREVRRIEIAPGYAIGGGAPPLFFAGPCVIESRAHAVAMGRRIREIAEETGAKIVYKSSYDKANRSSKDSFRGPGLVEGLDVLAEVKRETGLPLLSDVHEAAQVGQAAAVLDVLQIPAFLSRQTDLIEAAARAGKPLNVKKGQFLAPDDMANVVEKCRAAGNEKVILCERGTSFGYHDLVVDMRSFQMMRALGFPIVYDVTHSLQLPGGGKETGGLKQYAPALARAAAATGAVDGFFLEVHDAPDHALSDRSTQLDVATLADLIRSVTAIAALSRKSEAR